MITNFNNLKLLEGRRFLVTKPPRPPQKNNVLEVKQGKTDEHLSEYSEYMQDQYVFIYKYISINIKKKGIFHILNIHA